MVRYLGTDPSQPPSLVPFIQGIVVAPLALVYILIFDLESLKKMNFNSLLLALTGSIISWGSQEMLNAGTMVSKSGLGSMGFQAGIILPISYDLIAGKRELMMIDLVGIITIITI